MLNTGVSVGNSLEVKSVDSVSAPAVVLNTAVSVGNSLEEEEAASVDVVPPDTTLLIGGIPLVSWAPDSLEAVVDEIGGSVVEGTSEDSELEQPPSVTVAVHSEIVITAPALPPIVT